GGPPPSPATPTVAPALGGIAAGWDGTFADGAIIPMDWSRVEVHAAPGDDFTPTADTLVATIETAQGGIAYIPATVPQYVRLVARNTSGAASTPTDTVGPYAPRPVAGEIGIGEITETLIADGSITTPKVFANAITTAKLDVGSVDATALKADAITGKTITGGIINGAEFHSDDGAGGTVDIEGGRVEATSATDWKILVDPTDELPLIAFIEPGGETAGVINGSGEDGRPALNISSGPFADGAISDWRWLMYMGRSNGPDGSFWRVRRVRESNVTTALGGLVFAGPVFAQLGYIDTENTSANAVVQIQTGLCRVGAARLSIDPPASANSGLFLNAATGHTGNLFRGQVDGVDKFAVSAAGAITAAGAVSAPSLSTTGNATIGGTLGAADVTVSGQITKDATWSTLSTNTGWAGYGGAFGSGRYRRMPDGSVFLRDLINRTASTTATTGEVVATLPVGYRPTTTVQQNAFVGGSTGGSISVNINTTGTITISNLSSGAITYLSTGNGYISLNGYQFFTD
ncbi:hypothetical protein, partial [Streptomyces sp. NPDC060366]|uniref:hypothetical protein n=1 Tax=Streptomyces sp. NPDC060366 TaxID=3347105 RepID=UPI0036687D3E